ncbi:guanine nucleotide binding protein, alpha subunit [Pyronema domesticum]|uniref:Guanine nucleotide-binding protein alpha-2 subunit n=1 Tax=Pyronema omphalodes (strain CBS 100304) TaxID=1076935 RepID=U4KZT5_PYROM|nr:guanine nucleotide binding protein, alpha subunit [Pyronema domesticum]CCX07719.1 Similar to Guanine nucleotide-binding protein alpha-2 subunit; acc. no. Q05424 [Pyronema omphalodes CBS 100304]
MCMGGGGDDVEAKRHHEIEKLIRQDEKRMTKEVKLLLLGAGESGKSTILKQMKLIHASGFSKSDREDYKVIIFANLLDSIKITLEAMEQFDITLDNPQNELAVDLIVLDRELSRGEPFPKEYEQPFRRLWSDKGVQQAINRGNEFALHDNLIYFFDNLDRLFSQGYLPSDQDILRSRLKTTGITETIFDLGTLTYRMFDVGGQRSERKKWIHCFEGVTALLFLVAISGYDQCLVEDKDANQMQEALMLFESICNSQWFVKTSIILFLNKIDLFKQKIQTSPVNKYFPDYTGDPTDFKQASGFFQENFKRLNRSPQKDIYVHFTNATDTNLLKKTMASVQDMILQQNLKNLVL